MGPRANDAHSDFITHSRNAVRLTSEARTILVENRSRISPRSRAMDMINEKLEQAAQEQALAQRSQEQFYEELWRSIRPWI